MELYLNLIISVEYIRLVFYFHNSFKIIIVSLGADEPVNINQTGIDCSGLVVRLAVGYLQVSTLVI